MFKITLDDLIVGVGNHETMEEFIDGMAYVLNNELMEIEKIDGREAQIITSRLKEQNFEGRIYGTKIKRIKNKRTIERIYELTIEYDEGHSEEHLIQIVSIQGIVGNIHLTNAIKATFKETQI